MPDAINAEMSESLWPLAAATVTFVLAHFVLSLRPVRGALVAWLGRRPFLAAYSVAVGAAFVWMNLAYIRAPVTEMWMQQSWQWILALCVMPFASILLVAGATSSNPTMVGRDALMDRPDPARGIFKVTRHPIMWAIALWSAVHLIATGDESSAIFFGGFAILALAGMAHIDARKRADDPARFARFSAVTSAVPFVALAAGRTRVSIGEIGWGRIVGGLILYLFLMYGHEWAIGVVVAPGV
jgi:uncharacterized membrane protein